MFESYPENVLRIETVQGTNLTTFRVLSCFEEGIKLKMS